MRPPLNLWGRLAHFHWIIPRYDVMFVGPLLIISLGAAAFYAWGNLALPFKALAPIAIAVQVFVALTCPPSLADWQLTGEHRIVPAMINQASELQQTP